MKEAQIQAKAMSQAKDRGWLAMKFASPARRSVPDCMFIRGGRVVFIEFKVPGNIPTDAQIREISRFKIHGAEVHVCHSPEEARKILDDPQDTQVRSCAQRGGKAKCETTA